MLGLHRASARSWWKHITGRAANSVRPLSPRQRGEGRGEGQFLPRAKQPLTPALSPQEPGEGADRVGPHITGHPFRSHGGDCLPRSGENGTRRMRTPVASKIALAIAAATGRIAGSPEPVGGSSGWLINTTSMVSGVSVMSRIG